MEKIIFIVCTICFFSSMGGCGEDASELPLDFDFSLLNNSGEPSSTYSENETILFSFLIHNTSEDDLAWYNYCEVFSNENFYSVYQLIEDDSGVSSYEYIGQPFVLPVNCQDRPILVKPGIGYYLKIPWLSNPNNSILMAGDYKIEFDILINFNGQNISKTISQKIIIIS